MYARLLLLAGCIGYSFSGWAITCYLTLAKDNCWSGYEVSVKVISSQNGKILTTVKVPKDKQWTREIFPCEPALKLMYIASFSPVFWASDVGKTYVAQHYWSLPNQVAPGDVAWNISVCYASDFALVPYPPQATGSCRCDFSKIPAIKPPVK